MNTGRTRFKKGMTPWNKGLKTGLIPKSAFKKGEHLSEDHPKWKGEDVGYVGLHAWVKRHTVEKKICKFCKSTSSLNLANISGLYKRDLSDWMYLCRKCHHSFDNISTKMWDRRRRKDKMCAFTMVDDLLFYPEGTHIFINSFKRYHPDIDLIVFRQNTIDKVFKEKNINFYQAKPYFGQIVMEMGYKGAVNMDADHIVLDRLTEVFDNVDYDVAMPMNKNDYEDAEFENITADMYLQAGMVASTSKEFWLKWQEMNKDAMKYVRKENDIVNLLLYNEMAGLKLKVLDKEKNYYGCKSLGRESEFEIVDGKTMCRGEQVVAYHYARGNAFPKLDFDTMFYLKPEVRENWKQIAYYGQTVKIV